MCDGIKEQESDVSKKSREKKGDGIKEQESDVSKKSREKKKVMV